MSGPQILTFGCRLNAYESDAMRAMAEDAGLGDAVIVNTCAVTSEAEKQGRQAIRRARRANPNARIVVTGCAAQIAPERYAEMPEVDAVLGNAEKMRAKTWSAAALDAQRVNAARWGETAVAAEAPIVERFEGRTRAHLEVQNGCDHRCTFCVIPFGRGPSRSAPIGAIAARARALAAAGYPEIVLTGVDLTSYGHDLPGRPRLGQMIRRLLAAAPEVRRLRLSSIDVAEVDDDLMRLIADEPRFAPHLHLSLQSGDDMILKRMKRRHSRAQAVDFCAEARRLRPDIAFGADVIVGFPTETDAMFENSLRLVADCDLTHLHVFPYSPRPGTPAARMPQVDGPTRKARAAVLRAAGDAALAARAHARIGRRASLAIEAAGDHMQGRDSDFMPADVDGDAVVGDLRAGTIIGARNGRLIVALDREAAAA